MRRVKFVGLRFVAFGIAAALLLGLVTSALWNVLMPAIFGLPAIGFWQAIGLLLLSRLLFGRWGGRRWGGHRTMKPRFVRGMADLTPEERERFRQARCGPEPERV